MDQESTLIDAIVSEISSLDNAYMDVDTKSGPAEPFETKEELPEDTKLQPSALMNSGDGLNVSGETNLDEGASTSKSLISRVKRRIRRFTEVEVLQRIPLPRSSKTRAIESLRNISKPVVSSSASRTRKRKQKLGSAQNKQNNKRPVRRSNASLRQTHTNNMKYGRCAVHKKRCSDCIRRDSRMSFGSTATTGTSESFQSDECCHHCRHGYCTRN